MLLTTASAICYAIATSLVMLDLSPGVWYAVAAGCVMYKVLQA